MGFFLVVGAVGVALLIASLVFGDLDGHGDWLAAGDYLSMAAIAGFLAALGFTGALFLPTVGTAIASGAGVLAGVVVGGAAGWLTRLLRRQQSDPAPTPNAMLGLTGSVVSAVPDAGYGEVSLVVAGQLVKVNARSLEPVTVGTRVVVVAVLSPTSVQVEPQRTTAAR